MLMPLKSPNTIETIIIIPEMVKIDESNAIRRKCDHPGVVGENDSCTHKKKNILEKSLISKKLIINKIKID